MTISFKISDSTKQQMIEYFQDKKRNKTPAYAVFQADESDTVVTLYESGKVVFQGKSADIDARIWKETERHLNPAAEINEKNSAQEKEKKPKQEFDPKYYFANCVGSDEVGTGDYFGPIVVSAAYVPKNQIPFLENLGVKDSKKLTDTKILEIVPDIIKNISYESLILSNKDYNNHYSTDINMNKIKAILHNKVLIKLTNQFPDTDYVIVDEFAKPTNYFNYLKETKHYKKITFLQKAEDKNLAVACASLISRYIFLKEFDKLGEQLDMFLPKGASNEVLNAGVKIVNKYGIDKLADVAKLNFKTTDKIKELL